MKAIFFAIMLMGLLVLGSQEVRAQYYNPYAYGPYWGGPQYQPNPYPQQYDPYYDLHVLHYQLYLPYPGYPNQPFFTGVAPFWPQAVVGVPQVIITPRSQPMRRR